ncbi:thymidine kinase [Candidatus Woesebacteria bacterium]|nr:MAG: thymidine kinase [Candidatus Woesebacteria bacterium]
MSAESVAERKGPPIREPRIEVITGCMFCGKTDEMIRRLRRAVIACQKVQVFKHIIDKRFGENSVDSHAGTTFEAVPVKSSAEILELIEPDTTVVAVDEGQFFDDELPDVCQKLVNEHGLRVIVAGLDTDFRHEPFGVMPALMGQAEKVDKLEEAICMVCGGKATRTQRLINEKPAHYNDPVVVVGGSEKYEARCREHHEVPKD